jgi:hypothetical protein
LHRSGPLVQRSAQPRELETAPLCREDDRRGRQFRPWTDLSGAGECPCTPCAGAHRLRRPFTSKEPAGREIGSGTLPAQGGREEIARVLHQPASAVDPAEAAGAVAEGMEIRFRLPVGEWPRAVFRSDFGYRGARLTAPGGVVLRARTRADLERGVTGALPGGEPLRLRLATDGGVERVELYVGDDRAPREDRVWAKPTRSAWIHALVALGGSAAGFAASYFYLAKAWAEHNDWAAKMGYHTAGWHLLLTFTLFPASLFGQRIGIRAVQVVSLVFFGIHVSIALANSGMEDPPIAVFNALSGIFFLIATVYGNRAYRDMDPVAALRAGRV